MKTVFVAALCLTALPAFAAPLQKSEVSPAANWVAHVDLEAFRGSSIGKLVLAELQNQGLTQKLQDFATIFSFDPLQDIRDVTLYGKGQDRTKAVAVVEGRFDTQKLIALLRMNPQYQEIPYKGTTLYRWQQEERKGPQPTDDQGTEQAGEQMMYGGVVEGNRVVVGTGLETVQQAVDTLKGQTPTAASTGLLSQIPQAQGTVFAQVVATGVGDIVGQNPQAAMLKQTDSLTLTIGETTDKLFGQLSLQGQTAEVATNTAKMLEGLIAMVQFSAGEQPQLAELTKNIRVSSNDKTTQVRFEAPTQAIFQFVKDQWQQKQGQNQQQPATAP
jgi:hypothetical protein